MKRRSIAVLSLSALLPFGVMAADKPDFGSADADGDGKVTIEEAVKAGVPEKEANKEDIDNDGELTEMDWQFIEMEPATGSESKSSTGSGYEGPGK